MFVNRTDELSALEAWWKRPNASMALVWGRKRVGKTALIGEFARERRTIFHTARGAGLAEELGTLAEKVPAELDLGGRRLDRLPFVDWTDVIRTLAQAAQREPLLLVLDEFPELRAGAPKIEQLMRAVWDEVHADTKLRVLLCGSAVRTMHAISEERSALHGRFDLRLALHPFRPHEAAMMLRDLAPADRARVWGICGGVPLYLSWWDQSASLGENLRSLACTPGALLRTEGELILATDGSTGGLTKQVLAAIAAGKNRHSEIVEAVRSERQVSHILADLEQLRLIERVVPVTDDPRARSGRTTYRIADNYLAFWLGLLERYIGEIDRGLGRSIARVLLGRLDDHMGPRYEEALREHLRRLAGDGVFGDEVSAVGPYWTRGGESVEIDAVVLAGIPEVAVAMGECKWAARVNGAQIRSQLVQRARVLPRLAPEITYVVCARDQVDKAGDVLAVTSADIFA